MIAPLRSYLAECEGAFARAADRQPVCEYGIQLAEVGVRLRFAGPALVPATLPALAHLATLELSGPTVTVDLWDTSSTGVHPPPPPFAADDYRRYGRRAVAHADPVAVMHAPAAGLLCGYDRATRHGLCWAARADALSIYERAAPLQTLLHWALRELGWRIVHAAAVGTDRGGVLLIGNAGAGKSTTALSCLTQEGLRLLSDDKCLARLDPVPSAYAAFSSGKVKADMLERLPHLQGRVEGWDDSSGAGKGLVYLHPSCAGQLIRTFAIRALVMPHVAHQPRPALRPVAPAEAFRVFGPSTAIWLPGAEADSVAFTAQLVRRLPCYQLDLALDLPRNTDAILSLLESL